MKRKLVALSMLAASGLCADYYTPPKGVPATKRQQQEPQTYYQEDSCNPCEPCCVPKARKCIVGESFLPAYNILQCNWGPFITADFLYWFSREDMTPYALLYQLQPLSTGTPTVAFASEPIEYKNLETKWSPGFRAGLGWNPNYDGWDLYFNYTWMHNKKQNSTSVDPSFNFSISPAPGSAISVGTDIPGPNQFALINEWVNPAVEATANTTTSGFVASFDTVNAKWSLRLNQVDFEGGRKFWLSRRMSLRPYGGLRAAGTRTIFQTVSIRNAPTTISQGLNPQITQAFTRTFTDRYKDRYWGVGMVFGLQPVWYLGCANNLGIYGNLEGSLIYGKYKMKKTENYFQSTFPFTPTVANRTVSPVNWHGAQESEFFFMQPILDLGLGFSWQQWWSCDRFRTELDLGWEQHIWINHYHRVVPLDGSTASIATLASTLGLFPGVAQGYTTQRSSLMLGGLVVRFRFDF